MGDKDKSSVKLLIEEIFEAGSMLNIAVDFGDSDEHDAVEADIERAAMCEYGLAMMNIGAQLGSFACQDSIAKLPDKTVRSFFSKKISSSLLAGVILADAGYYDKSLLSYMDVLNEGSDLFAELIESGLDELSDALLDIMNEDDDMKNDLLSTLKNAKKGGKDD